VDQNKFTGNTILNLFIWYMLANVSDYDARITAGKRVEKQILDALRKKGYRIEDPTSGEDKHDKIDGWWLDKQGKRFPIQVKYRETGDDIIFELIQDFSTNNAGRDMKSKAVLYLVADTHGTTRMFLVKPIKDKAQEIIQHVIGGLKTNPSETRFRGQGWEAKVQFDRAHGQKKLVAYLKPNLFSALATWQSLFENKI
jgi:hypothetical protein